MGMAARIRWFNARNVDPFIYVNITLRIRRIQKRYKKAGSILSH